MYKSSVWLFIIIIELFSINASATIYREVDSKGVVTFSDHPTPAAETVKLAHPNVATNPTPPAASTDKTKNTDEEKKVEEKKVPYTTFDIKTPKDQETFQNATEISLSVNIQPALQKGDTIRFFIDGQPVNEASSSTTTVVTKTQNDTPILDRGSHSIHAVLYDEKSEEIKTTPQITIFIHYASSLFPSKPAKIFPGT